MVGMITDIQRFSLNDGPGIRTTVFFKGCDMRCAWCHNPETISPQRELHYHSRNCIDCFHCVEVCPVGAHGNRQGKHSFDPALCIGCGNCAEICYPGAMEMSGKSMSVQQVMEEILQDKPYYADSGGGVTLSGGEVLCQLPFAVALAKACRAEGIPVAIETNLNLPFEGMRPLLEQLDLVMCDIKLYDPGAHQKWVGADNSRVLENVKKLAEAGVPIIVRTPLIPGATDSEENIGSIAGFLAGAENLRYYELLNFNPLGASKYDSLSRSNPFADARPLPQEKLLALQAVAEARGVTTRIES